MKYLLIPLIFLGLFAHIEPSCAQRYLPGQIGLQFSGGMVDGLLLRDKYSARRFHAGIAVNRYNRNRSRWVAGIDYLQKDYHYGSCLIPKAQISAEAGYYQPMISNRGKDIFLSAGISAMAGFESSNWGDKTLPDGAMLSDRDVFI